jgi:chemotaxis protein MotA
MVVGGLFAARGLEGMKLGGFEHLGTLVLVVLGPLGAAVMSHDGASLLSSWRCLVDALRGRAEERRRRTLETVHAAGRALRAGKPLEASQLLEGAEDPLLKRAAPLLLSKQSGADLAELVSTLSYQRLMEIRSAEELFGGLSRATPAFGLVGTVLGLVDMLRALKDFDKLGPGMALAVTSTLYGLVLAQVVFVPLARILERYGQDTGVSAELLGRALAAIADGKALSEVRVLGADGYSNGAVEKAS